MPLMHPISPTEPAFDLVFTDYIGLFALRDSKHFPLYKVGASHIHTTYISTFTYTHTYTHTHTHTQTHTHTHTHTHIPV